MHTNYYLFVGNRTRLRDSNVRRRAQVDVSQKNKTGRYIILINYLLWLHLIIANALVHRTMISRRCFMWNFCGCDALCFLDLEASRIANLAMTQSEPRVHNRKGNNRKGGNGKVDSLYPWENLLRPYCFIIA